MSRGFVEHAPDEGGGMTGAALIAEILRREGTEYLFCYPTTQIIEASAKAGIRPVLCRQERVGVGMADGYTRAKAGRANGVFACQRGPGIENAFPGIAQAYAENVPILVLPAATAESSDYLEKRPGWMGKGNRHFSAADVLKPVTKWAGRAHSVGEIPALMRRAYQAMRSGKGGPALVEVPHDVLEARFEGTLDYVPVPFMRSGADPHALREAARRLLEARTPIIWAGAGVLYSGASAALVELAELLPAPVMTTNPGKSAFPEDHPLSLGAGARSYPRHLVEQLRDADLVFAIGSSLTHTPFGPNIPPGKSIIQCTNDASDINKDYRVDHAVVGDAQLVLEALLEELRRQRGSASPARDAKRLGETVRNAKLAWLAEWAQHLDSDEIPINQYRVLREFQKRVDPAECIVTHDSGSPREQVLPFWQPTRPGGYLGWGKSTQLGYGLGIIMGAKMASPDRIGINFMGDAAIGMTGMDLETAARNRIGIITVVFNNSVMACERHVMGYSSEHYQAIDVGGNYAKLAEALNVAARRVERPEDLGDAIELALRTARANAPFLLEVIVKEGFDFSQYPLPGL